MWQRGLNWTAIVMVGIFGLMWVGIVIYADQGSPFWMRVVQVIFGLLLMAWAVGKAARMLSRA
ncbi:hypothetical protein FXF51_59520 [Nonomuraea sp. PA05]|uniref:hypothetical protein n=1 Tax=Nonomuraea sp. PA05 TaxID=2604466 RepID=UPI0011D7F2A6|nr:hypothetical protein [Nonomuraea sp. PA05]TYB45964.1 hypothetical protein FXF51_59520 [Nonomuraea sp. PA05]